MKSYPARWGKERSRHARKSMTEAKKRRRLRVYEYLIKQIKAGTKPDGKPLEKEDRQRIQFEIETLKGRLS